MSRCGTDTVCVLISRAVSNLLCSIIHRSMGFFYVVQKNHCFPTTTLNTANVGPILVIWHTLQRGLKNNPIQHYIIIVMLQRTKM